MNPVDSNINTIRTSTADVGQGTRQSSDVASAGAIGQGVNSAVSNDAGSESVSFTQTAADLLKLETQLREMPGIDQARVDSIRQAINDGSYQVDAEKIVDNLLKREREMA